MSHPVNDDVRGAYFYFDLVRFLAASLVVIEHLRDLLWLQWPEIPHPSALFRPVYFITGFGAAAVTVFFVLSGYWIGTSVFRRMDKPEFWHGYLIDRLSRLWVVIVPALIIGGLCDSIGRFGLASVLHAGASGALTVPVDVATRMGPGTFAGNVLFLQTVLVGVYGSNGSLWSLSNEFWYYIWFPALLLSVTRRKPSLLLLALAIAIAGPHLLSGFVVWLMGAGLAWLDRSAKPGAQRLAGWVVWGVLVLYLVVASAVRIKLLPACYGWFEGGTFAVFAWTMLRYDPKPLHALSGIARLGAGSSFSLYAIHLPLAALGVALAHPAGRTEPGGAGLVELLVGYGLLVAIAHGFASLTEGRTGALRALMRARIPAGRVRVG